MNIAWLSRVVQPFGWARVLLAVFLAVTLHVFAVMQGLASSTKILVGGQFGLALAVQLSFALAGAGAISVLSRFPIVLVFSLISGFRNRPTAAHWMMLVNGLASLIYILTAVGLYMGLSSVSGLFGFIWQGIGLSLMIALPVLGLLWVAVRFVPAVGKLQRTPEKVIDQPELTTALLALVIVTVAMMSGSARATFMLDHNPVVEVFAADAPAQPMRLILSSGDWVLFVDSQCRPIYYSLAVINKIEHRPKAQDSFPYCSDADKSAAQS